ncbi:hypothetical protein pipiens_012961 [Culex pipiens pipiens]|uniref:Uncharacterized protein n=1 Tax=Culex pipiens pipiens TaxID=38569 RepID=A0ABD1D0A3_CULPP
MDKLFRVSLFGQRPADTTDAEQREMNIFWRTTLTGCEIVIENLFILEFSCSRATKAIRNKKIDYRSYVV